MKVEIVKTLKIASDNIVPKGVVFSDPVPDYVMREVRLGSKAIRVIDNRPPVVLQTPAPDIAPLVEVGAAQTPQPEVVPIKKPATKRERKRLVK